MLEWFRLALERFSYSCFCSFALLLASLLHLQEVCFYVFLKCLECLDCYLYAFNALCIEMVVVYAWMCICQRVVLSPEMFNPQ